MNKDKYFKKFKDPRWQKKRLEIFERDRFTCQACAAIDKTLNVHHIKYVWGKDPWDYTDDHLVTLCEDCHKNEKEVFDENMAHVIEMFKDGLFFSGDLCALLDFGGSIINKKGKKRFLDLIFDEAIKDY